jgi:hypothetical protein
MENSIGLSVGFINVNNKLDFGKIKTIRIGGIRSNKN